MPVDPTELAHMIGKHSAREDGAALRKDIHDRWGLDISLADAKEALTSAGRKVLYDALLRAHKGEEQAQEASLPGS